MSDNVDMSKTIAPKSDQLNADDLIAGPMTITVTRVSASLASPEQPVSIHFQGDDGKPYKPCKSMRRVLVTAWGKSGADYVGRSMTLYRDQKVKFGGIEVGGIRISHMSHIDADLKMALTESRAKRGLYSVKLLVSAKQSKQSPPPEPEKEPGDFEQTRPLLETADAETIEHILVTVRTKHWTRDEKLEIKRLSEEAAKRKRQP